MKKKICISLFLSLLLLQSACSGYNQPTASLLPTLSPSLTASPEPSAIISPTPTKIPPTKSNQATLKDYSKAYYDVVANLIRQYGFCDTNIGWFMGFLRGDLIDFDNDGVPELVCVYQNAATSNDKENVCIYRFSDNAAKLLVDKQMGDYVWMGGPPSVRYSYIDGKTYIIAEDDIKGKLERLYIYTVENGALRTINLSAKPTPKKGEDYVVDHYLNCDIDGKSVTEEEYRAQRDYYYKNAMIWFYIKDNGKREIYDEDYAAKFLKLLAADAEISDSDVDKLLQSKPQIVTPSAISSPTLTPKQSTSIAPTTPTR